MLQDRPPIQSLRARNIEARRQRILDAARQLIARGGVPALSMRKLATQSGLAVRTLYNLWGGRDAILRAVIDQEIDRMEEVLERETPLHQDPLARCRAVVTVSIRYLVEDAAVTRPMTLALYQGLSEGPSADGRVTTRATKMQRVAIQAAIEQGLLLDLLDPELLGRQIYHGYELAEVQWAFGAIDEAGFRTRALYSLYVALLGVATDAVRPEIEAELREIEAAMRNEQKSPKAQKRKSA